MQQSFPEVNGVTHRFVKVNGLNLHLAEAGSGEPLLMIHGWPQHWYMWRYQIPHLAQHYSVICPCDKMLLFMERILEKFPL